MHAIRAARQRHVDAIVHENARGRSARERDDVVDEGGKVRGVQIRFADLYELDPLCNGAPCLLAEAAPLVSEGRGAWTEDASGRDEAPDHVRPLSSPSDISCRAANISARSA